MEQPIEIQKLRGSLARLVAEVEKAVPKDWKGCSEYTRFLEAAAQLEDMLDCIE